MMLTAFLIACDKEPNEKGNSKNQITMVVATSGVSLLMEGTGNMTIDWGDGTPPEPFTLTNGSVGAAEYEHNYSSGGGHTIIIKGNVTLLDCSNHYLSTLNVSKNAAIKYLMCSNNYLSSLDISKNTELTYLRCSSNELSTLDVSKNTVLEDLNCQNNRLSTNALNTLFGTLNSNPNLRKEIWIVGNPGASDCDRSIAEKKGWIVNNDYWK